MSEDYNSEEAAPWEEPVDSGPILYLFTNHKHTQDLEALLSMFYAGAAANQMGVMSALNTETGKEELILVGVQLDAEGKTDCFPLAKPLRMEDVGRYRAPDGQGGWYNPLDIEETAKAKEGMTSIYEDSPSDVGAA